MSLERRTPLRRTGPPTSRSTLARRRRIPPVSATKRGQRDEQRAVREEVFARDGWACQVARLLEDAGPCYGKLTPHHRRKANGAQGGAYSLANLVAVCAHHNDEMESNADLARAARAVGLVVRRGDPDWTACG